MHAPKPSSETTTERESGVLKERSLSVSMAGALCAQMASMSLSSKTLPASKNCLGNTSSLSFRRPTPCQVFRSRTPLKVVAARVAGVEIPNNKHTEYAIRYIYGIGPTRAKEIVTATGLDGKRIRELSEEELTKLREQIENYSVEGDLRRFHAMNIRRLKEIQCYRGRRHIMNLPVRGQRTKTNARTRKGKVKTVAGKKK